MMKPRTLPRGVFRVCLLGALVIASGCHHASEAAPANVPVPVEQQAKLAALPIELPDFFVRQRLQIRWQDQRHTLDCVLQLRNDELTVVGLLPAGAKLFVLKQRGDTFTYEQFVPGKLPFEPERMLIDIHRAFLSGWSGVVPSLNEGGGKAEMLIDEHGQRIEQRWQAARVVERVALSSRAGREPFARVIYPAGWDLGALPEKATLTSVQYGYTLEIENSGFQLLSPAH